MGLKNKFIWTLAGLIMSMTITSCKYFAKAVDANIQDNVFGDEISGLIKTEGVTYPLKGQENICGKGDSALDTTGCYANVTRFSDEYNPKKYISLVETLNDNTLTPDTLADIVYTELSTKVSKKSIIDIADLLKTDLLTKTDKSGNPYFKDITHCMIFYDPEDGDGVSVFTLKFNTADTLQTYTIFVSNTSGAVYTNIP